MMNTALILPGNWLGMLGGGQLGRMFCFAAQSMGYKVCVFDPDPSCPASGVADRLITADYLDEERLAELASLCSAISIEFENVPARSLNFLSMTTNVTPAARCVSIAQDRIAEKLFIKSCGVPVAPHVVIESGDVMATIDNDSLLAVLPGILKTARLGYDGKGQVRVATPIEVRNAHALLGNVACVLEKQLDLAYEVSVLSARGADGNVKTYPLVQNLHIRGILATTIAPSPDASPELHASACAAAEMLATQMNYVGVLCVEFFILKNGSLIVNEIAPRPHNSGHYTIDACVVSQFEQQVRTMTGLPLGETRQHSSAVMLNLLGDLWFLERGENRQLSPDWASVVAVPCARLHLYGKEEARVGRKMGHITFAASTLQEARDALVATAKCLHLQIDVMTDKPA
ncbi:5-(carboxyamino)imidazole ribonucleotide synthase [Candidatus Pandoraea novymonadis]|uniref:N5-carboxyaminoimidazole ribonucleotide synthase n=1 Tax=Candidatus Pandoraea novymonadis TaxID=1808959 RepID=A0ABX5FF07_9BURK|nr:5-(carboxyamino)imidazole ribonucleotide synthase [Candidatus Pandoraea novymonadis]PSB91797.1 N5-carboxyaminoimidazole ribonucleotide synthase [Candidatus Pandoraea novymonadis]